MSITRITTEDEPNDGGAVRLLIWQRLILYSSERSHDNRDPGLPIMGVDFLFEPLQNELRFVDFLKR
jgi:hypothetical protein